MVTPRRTCRISPFVGHYSLSTQPQKCGPYAAKAGDYLLQIDEIEAAIKYYKLAVKHLEGPEKLDASLILYINMTHLGKTYEADLYLQSAISIAQAMGRDDYALTFEAARKLNGVPENEEVRAGVIPCIQKASTRDSRIAPQGRAARNLQWRFTAPHKLYPGISFIVVYDCRRFRFLHRMPQPHRRFEPLPKSNNKYQFRPFVILFGPRYAHLAHERRPQSANLRFGQARRRVVRRNAHSKLFVLIGRHQIDARLHHGQ